MKFNSSITEAHDSRNDWLQARRSMIGASDSAGILGCGYANQSAASIWHSKVTDEQMEIDDGLAKRMKIGKLMEPTLRAIFEDETGLDVVDPGEFTIYRSTIYDWLGCTLDGVSPEAKCPVELKNVSIFNRSDWEDGQSPLKFIVQCQHQMAVTGSDHSYVLGLLGGDEPMVRKIERDERFIQALLKRLETFWQSVQNNEMPPVDDSKATAKLMAKLWPNDSGEEIFLPNDATNWDQELTQAKSLEKEVKKMRVAAENKIKAAIGDATFGRLPCGSRYSWKTQERAGFTVEETSFRVLRRTK